MNLKRHALPVLGLSLLISSCNTSRHAPVHEVPPQESKMPLAWIEMGPKARVIARLITSEKECPKIHHSKGEFSMKKRVDPSHDFPLLTCEADIPSHLRDLQVGDQKLVLPKKNPKRILIIGDTGCRIKVDRNVEAVQECNDPKKWPFEKISEIAAAQKPDLVIHLGDYFYRQAPCPKNRPGCAGSPFGDNWSSWDADFFKPARKLLTAAPWVFIRGNHESCGRGAAGFMRYLDAGSYSETCSNFTEPYELKIGKQKALVFDSSEAHDVEERPKDIELYREQFKKVAAMKSDGAWLFSHRPLWAIVGTRMIHDSKYKTKTQTNLFPAFAPSLYKKVDLIFSGHLHAMEALDFRDGKPSQFIIGGGGTALDEVPSEYLFPTSDGRNIQSGLTYNGFGFFLLEKESPSKSKKPKWTGTVMNEAGQAMRRCKVEGSQIQCEN